MEDVEKIVLGHQVLDLQPALLLAKSPPTELHNQQKRGLHES